MPSARTIWRHVFAALAMSAAVGVLLLAGRSVNSTTAGLALVAVTVGCAIGWGSGPALLASVIGLLSFNYFFIPPVNSFNVREPEDVIASAVFLLSALTVGQLSSRAHQKAKEAEMRRQESERLYEQLKDAISEASEAESLRRSEKLKTALLDAVTHDLRTPLTAIKGSATTLLGMMEPESESSDEARRELLQVIDEESDRLNRFVEEMMEVAQIEGGHMPLQRNPTSAQEIVNNALERARLALRDHPVEVAIPERLPLLQVDAASVSAVVFELLENAAQYSPAESPIEVSARRGDNGYVQIDVSDRGPGIPARSRERVFEKFFREPERRRERHGFGLGLAIARGIVEAHGGRIWIADPPARGGTTVSCTLPCQQASAAGDAA